MTNRLAIILALVVALLLGADFVFQGGAGSLFLAKKFTALIEYLAFWR